MTLSLSKSGRLAGVAALSIVEIRKDECLIGESRAARCVQCSGSSRTIQLYAFKFLAIIVLQFAVQPLLIVDEGHDGGTLQIPKALHEACLLAPPHNIIPSDPEPATNRQINPRSPS